MLSTFNELMFKIHFLTPQIYLPIILNFKVLLIELTTIYFDIRITCEIFTLILILSKVSLYLSYLFF